MEWLRNKKNRIKVSLAAGLAAVLVVWAVPEAAVERFGMVPMEWSENFAEGVQDSVPLYGWWGTMYPKFCFSKGDGKKVKISFWLAKAFDW